MLKKTAACHCGALTLSCKGEPMFVVMCHCHDCQRRTGSSYNIGAWYEKSLVDINGEEKIFQRTGDEGIELSYHFCPECGSNVYWEASTITTAFGVAGGCFADEDFPLPSFSLYNRSKHHWLQMPAEIPCHIASVSSEQG